MNRKTSSLLKFLVISVVLLGLLVFGLSRFRYYTNDKLSDITLKSLSEIMEQQAYSFVSTLNAEKGLLESVATSLALADVENIPRILDALDAIAKVTEFEDLGFIHTDGRAITNRGAEFNAAEGNYFKAAMRGETVVSEPTKSVLRDEIVIVIATPIKRNNEIIGVLAGGYNILKLNRMFGESFGGAGYAFITDNDGTIIAHTNSPFMFLRKGSVLQVLEKSKYIQGGDYQRIRTDLRENRTGYFEIEFNNERRISWYKTISINNWNIFSAVPSNVINSQANDITFATGVLTVILVALVSSFGLYSYKAQKRYINKLSDIAYIDEVTGGSTLAKFKQRGQAFIERNKGKNMIITCCDINGFGIINDMYGYCEGDFVLKKFHLSLSAAMDEGAVCTRSVNDVFFALTTQEEGRGGISKRGRSLRANFQKFLADSGRNYRVTFSTSVYEIQPDDTDITKIIEKALISMREAKRVGAQNEFFYDEQMRADIVKRKNIENVMLQALNNGEFKLYIQPKYNMKTNEVVGGEALARWILPSGELVMPGDFIPVFEKTGFIVRLDVFMLDTLCKLQKKWSDEGRRVVPISVNQSKLLVERSDYIEKLCRIVGKYAIPARLIELELTESLVYENFDALRGIIAEAKAKGFGLAIDDFGSGYSSLGMLKEIYADIIKIDRSFLLSAERHERGTSILSSMVGLAKQLNMQAVCEGVETEEQKKLLLSLSCRIGQGFLYSRAVPDKDFEKLL